VRDDNKITWGGKIMSETGKQIRLERIMNRISGKTVIIPMDHGITMGPIDGLINMRMTINEVVKGGANAILLHKGIVRSGHRGTGKDVGLIVHLSASTNLAPDPSSKVLVCSVEEAIQLGADAVSIHVNIGSEDEKDMLKDLGKIGKDCQKWGMPLLAMMYTRGPKIKNEYDVECVKHAARIAAELGADIVKVSYTAWRFQEVTAGCTVPVVIAGGEKMGTEEQIFQMVKGSLEAGGAGVSIGRNVFQHKMRQILVGIISSMVHENLTVESALQFFEGSKNTIMHREEKEKEIGL